MTNKELKIKIEEIKSLIGDKSIVKEFKRMKKTVIKFYENKNKKKPALKIELDNKNELIDYNLLKNEDTSEKLIEWLDNRLEEINNMLGENSEPSKLKKEWADHIEADWKAPTCIGGTYHDAKMVAGDYFSWGIMVCSKCGKRV